ncbi:ATP synthase F1 subunit delta [cf. Phormidesmis sp. LEGE 11477]|uniref:ATP synthase F1 subunit delta n=1 Tax=cf. Phormidesmis sp. LEGE 11477 TaxID=1828680 RepID=UPI001880E203|nr:ATP synthase F1 subunit delta [cf. Phormidesmis sp. LEGE 11477]MBE9061070.1 F0F1 ATP synthase subunit delta [cf. Phormidesmis sp. LEGE 11477]
MSIATSEVAAPYAQALLSIAKSKDSVDAISQIATDFLDLIKESEGFRDFLTNPIANTDAKKGVINQVLGDDANTEMRNFLLLLVDRGRIYLVEPILKQFQAQVRELKQTVLAEVTSAVELSDEQKESVRQKVQEITQAKAVDLETSIDPDLIGGVIIQIGSQVLDASLRGQLRRISLQLGV